MKIKNHRTYGSTITSTMQTTAALIPPIIATFFISILLFNS